MLKGVVMVKTYKELTGVIAVLRFFIKVLVGLSILMESGAGFALVALDNESITVVVVLTLYSIVVTVVVGLILLALLQVFEAIKDTAISTASMNERLSQTRSNDAPPEGSEEPPKDEQLRAYDW